MLPERKTATVWIFIFVKKKCFNDILIDGCSVFFISKIKTKHSSHWECSLDLFLIPLLFGRLLNLRHDKRLLNHERIGLALTSISISIRFWYKFCRQPLSQHQLSNCNHSDYYENIQYEILFGRCCRAFCLRCKPDTRETRKIFETLKIICLFF